MTNKNQLDSGTEDLFGASLHENSIEYAFKMGRLHGKLGFPKVDVSEIENNFGKQTVDAYSHGYDHGYMERKTARTTNEELSEHCGEPHNKKDLEELSVDTLQSYVDKAEVSKKDHLDANIKAKRPEVQKFHDRLVYKRHDMQQKAIKKLKG